MKFIIPLSDLQSLLKGAGISRPKQADTLTLSACAARVFVEFKGDVAGIENLVLTDGAVALPAMKFLALLKTYKGTRVLSFEGGPCGLKIQNFTMPVLGWDPHPKAPAHFQLFPAGSAPGSTRIESKSR